MHQVPDFTYFCKLQGSMSVNKHNKAVGGRIILKIALKTFAMKFGCINACVFVIYELNIHEL